MEGCSEPCGDEDVCCTFGVEAEPANRRPPKVGSGRGHRVRLVWRRVRDGTRCTAGRHARACRQGSKLSQHIGVIQKLTTYHFHDLLFRTIWTIDNHLLWR